MLTWERLQAQARYILANVPSGEFKDVSFYCRSGGSPANLAHVPEVYRCDTPRYHTWGGTATSGEVVVRCRETGAVDINDRTIYKTVSGQLFVYRFKGGSSYSFDSGAIEKPAFSLADADKD